jgi:hypothetical protein
MSATVAKARRVTTIRAVVTRASGRVENYGVVSYSGNTPKRIIFKIIELARRAYHGVSRH